MLNYLCNHKDLVIGILATIICAVIPFVIASVHLARETKRLRKLITLIARGIEQTGVVTFRRDANDEFIALEFSGDIPEKFVVSASTEADPLDK